MTAEDMTTQALREEVSELTLRLKELGEENRDLREICSEHGIQYMERLAARRHKRYFADLLEKHPIGTTASEKHPIGRTATASDLLGAAPIVRGIAECAGSVLRTGLIARCFFTAFTLLTAQFPWKFGGRLSATFDDESTVESLTVLRDGRLASAFEDRTIKIWDVATRACVATLEGHEGRVSSLAVLGDGRLASGSDDQMIKIWDLATGAAVATLDRHKDYVRSLAVLDGGLLASGSERGTIQVWDSALSDIR